MVDNPNNKLLIDLRSMAEEIATKAADFLRGEREAASQEVLTKEHIHDVVTQADKDSEELVTDAIIKFRPNDGIIGEEGSSRTSQSGYTWVIDPCDGTRNFVHGGEGNYGVSIGIFYNEMPTVGVIYDVQGDALYSAANGHGATRDGAEIRVSGAQSLRETTIAFDGAMDFATKNFHLKVLRELWPQVGDVRRIGCTSVDYCRVADGTVDGTFGHANGIWDIAAGVVLVKEAGGRVGSSRGNIPLALDNIGATPAIFDDLQRIIASVGPLQR